MKGMRIFFALITILFTFNFIEADNFRYKRTKKSRYYRKLPEGLSQVAVIFQKNRYYPGLGGALFTLTPENLLKWKKLYPGIFPDIEEILKSNGLEYNLKNLKMITDNIYKIIRKAWADAKSDLKNCKAFEKVHKGRPYKQFIEQMENKGIPFNFNNQQSESEAYAWNETSPSGDNRFINFPHAQFYHITEYIIKKLKQNQEQIDIGDYQSDLNILYSYLGHEMMHAFTDVFHFDPFDTSKQGINRKERVECEVQCLQKQCFGSNVKIKSYCEKRCGPNYCDKEFEECKKKKPPPDKKKKDKNNKGGGNGPIDADKPDDNFSHSSGHYWLNSLLASLSAFPLNTDQEFFSYTYYPDILIYDKFDTGAMNHLLDRFMPENYLNDYIHDDFSSNHRLLIVPACELMGDENSGLIQHAFEHFVASGGTLLMLSQQYNTQIENLIPIPEGDTLKTYGFRQDQSCYHSSAYFEEMHPVLSSCNSELTTAAIDGYCEIPNSSSTVLLYRTKNRECAMLFYPYGNGYVFLTFFYTDWGYVFSQATRSELNIFRDLVTFAKNPHLPIPMYNLAENSNPGIELNVKIKNNTETPAAKVRLTAYNPDRNRVLYENEQTITINPEEEIEVPVNFTLPSMGKSEHGICHVDYELYDSDDHLLKMRTESDEGRFAIYKVDHQYTPFTGIDMWLTVEDEEVYLYEPPKFTLHAKNHTDSDKTLDLQYECNHRGRKPLFTLFIPTGEKVERPINLDSEEWLQRLWVFSNEGHTISKGVTIIWTPTKSTLTFNSPGSIEPGGSLDYSITSTHRSSSPESGDYHIRLVLGRYNRITDEYTELETIYETTHDFSVNGTFNFNGTYTPEHPWPFGLHRLKLEVEDPEGHSEMNRFQDFYFQQSGFHLQLDRLQKNGSRPSRLTPGQSYTIPIQITNNPSINNYDVKNGNCLLVLESQSGQEVYRKEITNISINSGEEKELVETFTFTPAELGNYFLKYKYWDETRQEPSIPGTNQEFTYATYLTLEPDKARYDYLDTATIGVKLTGTGPYTLHFTCAEAGIDETRNVQVPEESFSITEVFQIPIGIHFYYKVYAEAEDATGRKTLNTFNIYRNPLRLDYTGSFKEPFARAGSNLHLDLNMKGISGMSNPLTGELSITCSLLNYEDIKTVTLQPLVDNPFTCTIPMGTEASPGPYEFDVSFKINNMAYIEKQHFIYLPDAAVTFSAPADSYNAGDTIPLSVENTGGKSGNFEIEILLRDSMNKLVAQKQETQILEPGGSHSINVTIPGNLKTDKYLLTQKVTETFTHKGAENAHSISITGLNAILNSYALKDKFFNNEIVTGKSEMTAGTGHIENGVLDARIIKLEMTQPIETILDDRDIECLEKDGMGRLWVGKDTGVSVYDGSRWQDYTHLSNGDAIGYVSSIAVGPGNKTYALGEPGIVVIDETQNSIQAIPNLWSFPRRFGVDNQSRIWADFPGEMDEVHYYDGTWHYAAEGRVNHIISDGSGGVWLTGNNRLSHIKSNLSIEDFTPYNSNMPSGDIQTIYVDNTGNVWLIISYTLFRFDKNNWTDFSSYDGYPLNGMIGITGDDKGNIYGIGTNSNFYHSIYQVEDKNTTLSTLLKKDVEFAAYEMFNNSPDFATIDGYLYTYGGFGDANETGEWSIGLLKIGIDTVKGDKEVWTHDYPVDISTGSTHTLDLNTETFSEPGLYILETRLLSSLEQVLAESSDTFSVRDSDVSVSMLTDSSFHGVVKKDSDQAIDMEIFNNTAETKPDLNLIIKKISPSGTEEEILSETLTLAPGQTENRGIVFNESLIGTWRLSVQLSDSSIGGGGEGFAEEEPPLEGEGEGEPSGGEEEGGGDTGNSGTVLSETEMLILVAEPSVTTEITAPTYAGDDTFDIKIKLINNGDIGLVVSGQWLVVSNGEIKLEKTIPLNPGQERLLTFNDTITSDRSYTFTLSGDVETSETITVQYGYVENFSINILPSYREGNVTIGYTIANGGGLAFSDDLHFELYVVGGTVPLYTIDRSYTLYPGESAIADTIALPLAPGNYQLKYRTSKNPTDQESPFTVQPSGIGTVSFTGNLYLVGIVELPYQVTNTDTVAGQIPITITINDDQSQPIFSETRHYYLEPGQTQEDLIDYEFTQSGNYTLTFSGSKISAPVSAVIQILNLDEVTANLSIGTPETDRVPVTIDITNSGYNTFSGTLVMEIDGIRYEETINVSTASSFNETFEFETAALVPGTKEVQVFLYDLSWDPISEATGTAVISGPNIRVIEVPENLEIDAGSYADVTLKLKNEGHLRGEAILKVSAFDSLFQERDISLEPGEEIEIADIFIDAPADLPTGNYPFNYTLTGTGVENSVKANNFNFKVNGISLDVDASLDHSLYNEGETAQLTLDITSETASDASLEAVVNWGNFSERRPFTLSSGSESLVFNIPLEEKREEKIFYGIYHEGSKGIHLNDIYIYFQDAISVETDRQVYEPGEVIHAVFTGEQSGTLTVEAFDESHTLIIASSASADFQVPEDTLGGTYGISWNFVPSDTSQPEISGSHLFDVSGLVVKVARSELEKGKYTPGETVKATLTFESNRDDTLELGGWFITPTGEWEYLGETNVTVSADRHVNALSSYTFNTTEAGTHKLVFGLYKEDKLIVYGSLAFDVGDAVMTGITTDHFEYKEGNENVVAKIDYFGEGTAQLELYLDGEKVEERSLTISGIGSTEISLASSSISGGSHGLKVILTKDGLTSKKSTGFIYGTNLPDLAVTLTGTQREGLDYTYKIDVTNSGKTASTATSLVFTDNETAVETVSIPALQPGTSHETTFDWSGSGKAGSHEFVFEVDNNNTVKEFSETNNSLTFTEDVPVIFYTLEVEPVIWPANSDITIITRLINNQNSVTPMVLNLSITNESSGEVIFERALTEEMPAFGSKTISDIFNTGVYPAGEYTLGQTLSSDTVDLEKSISIFIETTKAIDATLDIQPQTITADIDVEVELTMTLTNDGNVPLEDEILIIEVFNKDNEEIVKSEELVFSIPLAEQITETKIISLNLVEGNYEIRLKYLEELLTAADLIAAGGIEGKKEIAVQPRVLVMNLHLFGKRSSQVEFLTNLLQIQKIENETGPGILDSYLKLHKGHSNVNIVLGNLMGKNLGNELQERVWRGEGLILVCEKPTKSHNLVDFLGVKVQPIKGKDRDKHITLLPCELSSGGEIELKKKNKLMLKKEREDVIFVGQTRKKKHPVLAWRKYGNGHILVVALPLEFKAGIDEISQLLLNAVYRFSKDVYSPSELTRILPIKLSITNKASEEKSLVIKELLPYGVEGYGYDPEPEEDEDEELKWNLKVPGAGEVKISYWLKLPDQINIYDIKTEIYEGETIRDELSITFEVSQTVLSRLDELIVEIESMDASGKDDRFLRKAAKNLQKIRNRTGDSLSQHLVNLFDSIEAANNLGKVKAIDVSSQRLKTQNIMIIMGRRFYENVKTWGASKLTPFTRMITGE